MSTLISTIWRKCTVWKTVEFNIQSKRVNVIKRGKAKTKGSTISRRKCWMPRHPQPYLDTGGIFEIQMTETEARYRNFMSCCTIKKESQKFASHFMRYRDTTQRSLSHLYERCSHGGRHTVYLDSTGAEFLSSVSTRRSRHKADRALTRQILPRVHFVLIPLLSIITRVCPSY